MVINQKVLLIIAYRALVLCKSVTETTFGLTDVERPHRKQRVQQTTLEDVQVNPSDMEILSWALEVRRFEGRSAENARDVVEGILDQRSGEAAVLETGGHLGCSGAERSNLGANLAEAEPEELGVRDRILGGGWARGGAVKVAMGVGGFEIDVGAEMVTRYGDREVQEGEGGIRDGPGEFEVG
eukprot:g47579.t1